MDFYSFVSPARIKVLVVPDEGLSLSHFRQYYDRLRYTAEVRLSDVSLEDRSDLGHFNPAGYPNGRLFYIFETFLESRSIDPFLDLEPWRQQFLVIAIGNGRNPQNDKLEQRLALLKEQYNALCHFILVFGVESTSRLFAPESKNNKYIIPILKSNFTSLESAMVDISALLLESLAAKLNEQRLKFFKSPGQKCLESEDGLSVISQKQNLVTELMGALSFEKPKPSDSPQGLPKSHKASPDLSQAGAISVYSTERAKACQKGRSLKYAGCLYLLAGQLNLALETLSEALAILNNAADYLWTASALENIGVCLTMLLFSEAPTKVPLAALMATGQTKNTDILISTFLPILMDTVMKTYIQCHSDLEEALPPRVYHETALRYATLLVWLRLCGGWSVPALNAVVRGNFGQPTRMTKDSPSIQLIEEWCALVYPRGSSAMTVSTAARLYTGLATLYNTLGLMRKKSFVMNLLLSLLNKADSEVLDEFPKQVLDAAIGSYKWRRFENLLLNNCILFSQRIGASDLIAEAVLQMLRDGAETLDHETQKELARILDEECKSISHPYWDPKILKTIEIPGKDTMAVTQIRTKSVKTARENDDLIYNPFERPTKDNLLTVEAGKPFLLNVHLSNPYAFEVQIYELYLVNEEKQPLGGKTNHLSIPPLCIHVVSLYMNPDKEGLLEIAGCYIQVNNCTGDYYWLSEPQQQLLKRSKIRGDTREDQPDAGLAPIPVQVLPARPQLVLQNISLNNGCVMLLDGELILFSITVLNTSAAGCPVLQFGFNDSTVEPLQLAAARPDATRAELYEYEIFLYQRRAIELISKADPIGPMESKAFNFWLRGKRGLSSATVLVDYGLAVGATRRLRVPLSVTVYTSIELDRVDIFPTPHGQQELLLVLDLRNSWRETMEVSVWSLDSDDQEATRVTHTIQGLQVQRFLLPLPWSYLSHEHLSRPIPSLSSKQYVVDTRSSSDAIQNFWLREELLRRIRGDWRVVDQSTHARSGRVELRGIQLSRKMARVLRTDPLLLSLSAASQSVECNTHTCVTSTITNRTSKWKAGMLRFLSDTEGGFLVTGTLQRPITLQPEETKTIAWNIIYLLPGKYELRTIFDVIGGGQLIQKDTLKIDVHLPATVGS